jgi:hypothetical protein
MAFSLPNYRDLLRNNCRWDRPIKNPDPFGRAGSVVLRVLWVVAVWGMVLYVRHRALAAAASRPAPEPSLREAIVGAWEFVNNPRFIMEFTGAGRFQVLRLDEIWIDGVYQLLGEHQVGVIVWQSAPRAFSPPNPLAQFDVRFTAAVTNEGLAVFDGGSLGDISLDGVSLPPRIWGTNAPMRFRGILPPP